MGRFIRTAILFVICLGVPAPTRAVAQTVFFDDFDGDALLPHWNHEPSRWEYNVSGGMLNVTALLYPSAPHPDQTNFAIMGAPFAPVTDFRLDARMGWDSIEAVARCNLTVQVNSGLIASIGYCESFCGAGGPGIYASTSSGRVVIPSPPPGMYDFAIARVGGQFSFYFEGGQFASLTSGYNGPLNGVSFFFSSPYPGPSGGFHIDRVRVVPAPGAAFLSFAILILAGGRRRGGAP